MTAAEHASPDRAVHSSQAPGTSVPASEGEGHLSYEAARDQLTEVVRQLEGGGLTLEQSLELWERGERLAAVCSEWLEGARARLAAALPDRKGEPGMEAPF